ncbi:MAG: TRAP transporter large permease [Deltaproteobacteria bacterium]|nr:TRAP transporter large permease [Deltaproteobacteria bacterium]
MEPVTVGIICLCLFFLFIFIGMPIGFAFLTIGFFGFVLVRTFDSACYLLGSVPYTWGSTYQMVVIPLFILMGQFAFQSGISKDLYESAYKWVGGKPGGIALATTVACTLFAACTGSSLASAATMGTIAMPEMKKFKYSMRLATGCVAAGGTLGILIPPSVVFIVYGFLTGSSIGKLFIAGIIPGILIALIFLTLIYVRCRINPDIGPRGPSSTWKEKIRSLLGVWGMLALFILIIGGLYLGVFTPSEAGAIGASGAFIIMVFKGRLTWLGLSSSLVGTIKTTAMIFMILIGAQVFNGFLTLSGIPAMIAAAMGNLPVPNHVVLIIILLVYIPLGMMMDGLPMILLTLPTLFPIVVDLGFDPIWFGVLTCVMCELSNITPPMGMNLYIIKGVSGGQVSIQEVIMGAIPFSIALLICLAILVTVPQISLFLPGLMG